MAVSRNTDETAAPIAEIMGATARGAAEGAQLRERVATLERDVANHVTGTEKALNRLALDMEKMTTAMGKLSEAVAASAAGNAVRFAVGSKGVGWVMGIVGAVMGSVLTAAILAVILRR